MKLTNTCKRNLVINKHGRLGMYLPRTTTGQFIPECCLTCIHCKTEWLTWTEPGTLTCNYNVKVPVKSAKCKYRDDREI
jgi:hypothetical protein